LETLASHPERDRGGILLPTDNSIVLKVNAGVVVAELVVREEGWGALESNDVAFGGTNSEGGQARGGWGVGPELNAKR
jgi:hypothetical protein